jgi:hypothetical protein
MTKFVPLDEAAQMLGMTSEELTEARENNLIHGYRDGSSWKFKEEEVQRFGQQRQAGDSIEVPDLLADDEDDESILLSEQDLGSPRASSTIIGAGDAAKGVDAARPSDSDLMLAGEDAGSDVLGSPPPSKSAGDSDVQLVAEEDGSDVKVVPGSSSNILGDTGSTGSDLQLDVGRPGSTGTGELSGVGSSNLGLGSDLDDDEELALGDDDDDLVLSGSGTGSDVTMGGSDTGINLASPSDSGLLLDDEALDLGSVSSLELPEDEDVVALGDDAEEPVVRKDEEFVLSQADAGLDDEDTSGSQIIELDTGFSPEPASLDHAFDAMEPSPIDAALTGTAASPAMVATPAAPELPYSAYNVFFLGCTVVVLALCGILMFDVVRNMWSWDQATNQSMASGIMDGIVNALSRNK